MSITFTPYATLLWDADKTDWRERLFCLAAKRVMVSDPIERFWQGVAETLLTAICHCCAEQSEESTPSLPIPPCPTDDQITTWLNAAPPMPGGEYLTGDSMRLLWAHLFAWCTKRIKTHGCVSAFLDKEAPAWRQVGRVTFHLAENKADYERPFAFMATYVDGLGSGNKARHLPLGQALQRYAEENDRAALIRLLSPVQTAADSIPWVNEMLVKKELFHPLAFTPRRAYQLLTDVPKLEHCGIRLRLPDWWKKRPRPTVSVRLGEKNTGLLGLESLVSFDVRVALGETTLSPADIEALLHCKDGLFLLKGQWVEVDRERLAEVLRHWKLSQGVACEGVVTFAEAMRLMAGIPGEGGAFEATDNTDGLGWQVVEAGDALRGQLAALRDPAVAETLPAGLKADLRPYQRKGLAWLRLLSGMGLGACLADDMGLGKTIQVLSLLLHLKEQSVSEGEEPKPSLLVVPASLLGNWRAEAAKFTPGLRLAFLHPSESSKDDFSLWLAEPSRLQQFDLTVTTYAMLTRHADVLATVSWRLLILDEAQAVKNPDTRQTRAVRRIQAQSRIALTGTPIENRVTELWSLFNCINPGLLGTAKGFKSLLNRLGQRETDQFGPLRRLVAPYILRRMKTDKAIISDLPDKTETTVYCRLTPEQIRLYEQVVETLRNSLLDLEAHDIQRSGLVLQSLLRLKQICNHPCQLTGHGAYAPKDSGKFLRIEELCTEMAERQERVLVFTQFQEIMEPLFVHLERIFGRPGLALHGGVNVSKRKALVDSFQRPDGPPFFLLSLKAGGTGLNLTAASQVIHFDRWWNPAVEDQATDRAFRIGQKNPVLVHKCVTQGTLEERIDKLLHDKRHLAQEILQGEEAFNLTTLDDGALLDMLQLDISRATL